MLKFFRENFIITNDCIILATPMVLFFIFLQMYIQNFEYNLSSNLSYIIFYVTLWVVVSGSFAGWFYMVKKTLQFSKKTFLFDTDRVTALSKLVLCLFKGIGRFFLSFLVLVAVIVVLKIAKTFLIILFPIPFSLIYHSQLKSVYNLTVIITSIIEFLIYYGFIFWIPEIVYNYANPFKAIISSFKKGFITLRSTFWYYLVFCIFGIGLHFSIINSTTLPWLYFLLLLISYYFVLYTVILFFRHYEQNFTEEN